MSWLEQHTFLSVFETSNDTGVSLEDTFAKLRDVVYEFSIKLKVKSASVTAIMNE